MAYTVTLNLAPLHIKGSVVEDWLCGMKYAKKTNEEQTADPEIVFGLCQILPSWHLLKVIILLLKFQVARPASFVHIL